MASIGRVAALQDLEAHDEALGRAVHRGLEVPLCQFLRQPTDFLLVEIVRDGAARVCPGLLHLLAGTDAELDLRRRLGRRRLADELDVALPLRLLERGAALGVVGHLWGDHHLEGHVRRAEGEHECGRDVRVCILARELLGGHRPEHVHAAAVRAERGLQRRRPLLDFVGAGAAAVGHRRPQRGVAGSGAPRREDAAAVWRGHHAHRHMAIFAPVRHHRRRPAAPHHRVRHHGRKWRMWSLRVFEVVARFQAMEGSGRGAPGRVVEAVSCSQVLEGRGSGTIVHVFETVPRFQVLEGQRCWRTMLLVLHLHCRLQPPLEIRRRRRTTGDGGGQGIVQVVRDIDKRVLHRHRRAVEAHWRARPGRGVGLGRVRRATGGAFRRGGRRAVDGAGSGGTGQVWCCRGRRPRPDGVLEAAPFEFF
mmetsp:Transcript_112399/g.318412  ORF Transcript_112399/g.318412 Transcript_112399/m.318412 type:complete len:420 (+) Transcript_112399:93-1352(+)